MDEVVNDLKALEQLLLRNTGGSYGISSHLFLLVSYPDRSRTSGININTSNMFRVLCCLLSETKYIALRVYS